jgi:hypothetical protein
MGEQSSEIVKCQVVGEFIDDALPGVSPGSPADQLNVRCEVVGEFVDDATSGATNGPPNHEAPHKASSPSEKTSEDA